MNFWECGSYFTDENLNNNKDNNDNYDNNDDYDK